MDRPRNHSTRQPRRSSFNLKIGGDINILVVGVRGGTDHLEEGFKVDGEVPLDRDHQRLVRLRLYRGRFRLVVEGREEEVLQVDLRRFDKLVQQPPRRLGARLKGSRIPIRG